MSEQAIAVPELERDEIARAAAEQFIRRVGSTAVSHSFEAESVAPIESLYDAIQMAAEGNEQAREMVEINAKTDIIERTHKSGHISEVLLDHDNLGFIYQNGQSMDSVQANSLRFAAGNKKMYPRVTAEVNNSFRLRQEVENGTLEDHSFVVFSAPPDNMSNQELKEAGFFIDTMSTSIQVTTKKDGKLSLESAFVSGVKEAGEERVDIETIVAIGKYLGVDLSNKTAAEILDTPLLIPNSLLENGVIGLVQLWDIYNKDTFFGQRKELQDYQDYRERCREREEMLQAKVDIVTDRLISKAHRIKNRVEAAKLLNAISADEMIQQAIFDHEINPAVFGDTSETLIIQARSQVELGNIDEVIRLKNEAVKNDTSSSCPSGMSNEINNENKESSNSATCTFVSKQCPKCGAKNVLTTVTSTRISGSCGCSKRK